MCGLNLAFTPSPGIVERMNAKMSYRGVRSDSKSYFGGSVHLGHVRLPIQGLSSKHDHPISLGEWDAAMVGEVFNYKSFDKGAKTDLPVVLRRWKELGPGSLMDYDGFWAIVFIDQKRGAVHIVTDPLAKKPLYIRHSPFVAVSSEISPLVDLGPVTENKLYFSAVAKWGYSPTEETPFNEISKVPAFTHLTIWHNGAFDGEPYGEIAAEHGNLKLRLENAVENRLVSDVPISLLLSGGLDSTIIFELIKKKTTDFTVFHVDNGES